MSDRLRPSASSSRGVDETKKRVEYSPSSESSPTEEYSPNEEGPSSAEGSPTENTYQRKYRCEWQQLSLGLDEVRRRALTGALRASRMRSVAWAILLDVLPPDSKDWLNVIRNNRKQYDEMKEKYVYDPRVADYTVDNPLSQTKDSKWNQYFLDQELQSTIKLDVVRTFPGMEIFKQNIIRVSMTNILFIYAKETPDLMYRQGMHEILAPLLFILHSDHRAAEHLSAGDDLTEIMNPLYIEHDGYALFNAMMVSLKKFYTVNELANAPSDPSTSQNKHYSGKTEKSQENEIVKYLRVIKENTLSVRDPELSEHLDKLDIPLTLFGIRWLRVLFGREFPLQDVLVLWDIILAEGDDFSLTGFILVSMLITIRNPLLKTDLCGCLTVLLNYPGTVDIQYVIDYALYLKNPDLYCKPIERNFNVPVLPKRSVQVKKIVKNPNASKSKKMNVNKLKIAYTAEENVIIDGDILQDAALLRQELSNAYQLMSDCSLKLSIYEDIIRRAISITLPRSDPIYQTLNDIKELCSIMQLKCDPIDIEPALEANDFQYTHKNIPRTEEPADTEDFVSFISLVKDIPLKLIKIKSEITDHSKYPSVGPFCV